MDRFAPKWTLCSLLLVFGLTSPSRGDEDELPYRAYVVAGETDVRSGPGDAYYATERLSLGAEVEVHRRDPGGWLAIRPPTDSFCWIPADKLEMTAESDVARVVAPDTVAWMGSNVANVSRHRWQVKLEPGERVAVLGADAREDSGTKAARTWCKIAPPAGEFRWVHGDDVRRLRQGSRAEPRPTRTEPVAAATRPAPAVRPTSVVRKSDGQMTITTNEGARSGAGSTAEPANASRTAPAAPRSEWTSVKKRPPEAVRPAAYETEATGAASRTDEPAAPHVADAPGGRRRGTLRILNTPDDVAQTAHEEADGGARPVRPAAGEEAAAAPSPRPAAGTGSSNGVVPTAATAPGEPRVVWAPKSPRHEIQQLDAGVPAGAASGAPAAASGRSEADAEREDIELQLSQMVAKAPQLWNLAALRGRTEALVERAPSAIERGQARLLLDKIAEWEELYDRQVQIDRGVVVPQSGAAPAVARTEPRFDGSGWLFPVRSVSRSAPPYAIVDESGAVLQYVTPAPGVNLHRYERKKVGIYGQRASVRDLSAPVLTAHRVIDIDRQTVR